MSNPCIDQNAVNIVYIVLYIHIDNPEFSEILGVFKDKNDAINELLFRANYRQNKDGQLTQYMVPTSEYPSYEYLRQKVGETMFLSDVDVYRIVQQVVQ